MIFQFSDGEFSDPIATSLKMWKKSIVLSLFAFSVTLEKLKACGVRDNELDLLRSYLSKRTQYVHINGSQSIKSINQLYLNTVNGSASWFSDMPCDNYNLFA